MEGACGTLALEEAGSLEGEALLGVSPDMEEVEHFEHGPGVALGDLDGDGWLDALVSVAEPELHSLVLRNDGAGGLTPDPGFTADGGPIPAGTSAALADLDGDGDLDGVLSRTSGLPDLLLWNDGAGRFTSEALAASTPESLTVSVGDLDGDGRLDLFVAGFAALEDRTPEAMATGKIRGEGLRLYMQRSPGVFTEASARLPPEVLDSITFMGTLLDAEGDGDLDIYLANDFGGYVVPSNLLINDGAGIFSVHPDCSCTSQRFIMGAAAGDADGDGDPDLFLTDIGRVYLLSNSGDGTFVDTTLAASAVIEIAEGSSDTSWGASFVDLDRDGREDVVAAFGATPPPGISETEDGPEALLRGLGDGAFLDCGAAAGLTAADQTRSVAIGDLDRDGRPDLVTAGYFWVRIWRNASSGPAGLTVSLDAGPGNRQGFGAKVVARWEGGSHTSWLLPGTTFSASAPELYPGLGAQAGALEVTWPDGAVSTREVKQGDRLHLER